MLKDPSVPARALSLARQWDQIFISPAIENEMSDVFGRPKIIARLDPGRQAVVVALIMSTATMLTPTQTVADCRDAKDNKYLELALAADADVIESSDSDLLVLDPWRGVRIMTPAAYVALVEAEHPT